jgi:hypothetical protein
MLDYLPLHDNACNGVIPIVSYFANEELYTIPYWLANIMGFTPFIIGLSRLYIFHQIKRKKILQESKRKRKRILNVLLKMLQARFHILTTPSRLFKKEVMKLIIKHV